MLNEDDPEHYDTTPAVNLWLDSTVNPRRPHAKKYKKSAQLANFESDSTNQ